MIKPRKGRERDSWSLEPTPNQTFRLEGSGAWDFLRALNNSYRLQEQNRIEDACNVRYAAVQRLVEILPDDEETILEFGHANSRAALELLQASSADHFLAGDFEMAAALSEQLLELDPEDHLGNIALSGFCYVEMEEYELYDEISCDISDSVPERHILDLWSAFRRTGVLPASSAGEFRRRFAEVFAEFVRDDHPADKKYMSDMAGDNPSRASAARRLWLQTEHLWLRHPDFIEALRSVNTK